MYEEGDGRVLCNYSCVRCGRVVVSSWWTIPPPVRQLNNGVCAHCGVPLETQLDIVSRGTPIGALVAGIIPNGPITDGELKCFSEALAVNEIPTFR